MNIQPAACLSCKCTCPSAFFFHSLWNFPPRGLHACTILMRAPPFFVRAQPDLCADWLIVRCQGSLWFARRWLSEQEEIMRAGRRVIACTWWSTALGCKSFSAQQQRISFVYAKQSLPCMRKCFIYVLCTSSYCTVDWTATNYTTCDLFYFFTR